MILPPTSEISHHHKVTNIMMTSTSLSPRDPRTNQPDFVRDFLNFLSPGQVQSEIFNFFLVLVLVGPGFLKIFLSWSDPVLNFSIFRS